MARVVFVGAVQARWTLRSALRFAAAGTLTAAQVPPARPPWGPR